MKRQKVFVAVTVVFVLFIFTSIAYADDGNYGKPFRRLQEGIRENEVEIQNLYGEIAALHSLISGLEVRIQEMEDFIDALADLENLPETLLVHKQEILSLWGDIDEIWGEILEPTPAMMAAGYGQFVFDGVVYPLGTELVPGQVKIYYFGQEGTAYDLQIAIASPGIDLEEFGGWGNPPGAGNVLAVNILSPFDMVEPGTYDHYGEGEAEPYTWGDLGILPGYDSEELGNPEYISIRGNDITITPVGQGLYINFPEAWVVEDPEEPDADEYRVSGYFTIIFSPPGP